MAELRIDFVLPRAAPSRAVFVTDYGLRGGRLLVADQIVVEAASRDALARGVTAVLERTGQRVEVRALDDFDVQVTLDGEPAVRADRASTETRRAAWLHAVLALGASACGFAASFLYVVRARVAADPWAMKMAVHMAGWHLLLTIALFPAAVWGGRFGRHAVRATALLFFLIHLGIALANGGASGEAHASLIAALNAASGLLFLATTLAPAPSAPRRRAG
jgi:hypothetical protein